jgi:hypothetical protein
MVRLMALAALGAAVLTGASGQKPTGTAGTTTPADHVMVTRAETEWSPAPPSLPAGAEIAVLAGDMAAAGPFTARAKFPDGYRVPPHWHPADENVTVIEGTLMMGMGEQFSEASLKPLTPGSYAKMPKGSRHFVVARGATEIQIHAIGPWAITYVNPSDDPRNTK